MPVYKNEDNGTWYVLTRYLDWKGERKQKCKRGFGTKREAQEWERVFKQQSATDMDMNFAAFVELYIKDMKPRLKENTWLTKKHIIETKILPYFEKKNVNEITTKDVISSAPFLTTLSDTMIFVPTPPQKPEIWVQRNARK